MNVPYCTVALAYLWETTPVLGTEALPMYAADEFRLPGAPWIKTGENFKFLNENSKIDEK